MLVHTVSRLFSRYQDILETISIETKGLTGFPRNPRHTLMTTGGLSDFPNLFKDCEVYCGLFIVLSCDTSNFFEQKLDDF